MATATETLNLAASTTPKSILLPCPKCGEGSASISLQLNDLDGDGAFHCQDCDNDFSVEEVREFIAKWTKMLAWVEMVPQFNDE